MLVSNNSDSQHPLGAKINFQKPAITSAPLSSAHEFLFLHPIHLEKFSIKPNASNRPNAPAGLAI